MINYPFSDDIYKNNISHKNRGLSFEERINETNQFYLNNNIALIYKRPTPIKVLSFDDKNKIITKAIYEKDSTTDYNGVYKGRYIDFEAKSTISKTSLPISNIKMHQINHLNNVIGNGGIAFFLIEFSTLNKIYLLKAKTLIDYITTNKSKSLSIKFLEKEGYKVTSYLGKPVHYLENIEKIFNF